jgi:hypothetical protein
MYTLEQIIKTWHECYGEDMTEEYAGFLDSLQARGYSDDKILGELYEQRRS